MHGPRRGHIARITGGRDFSAYCADDVLRWAVERQFMIVGEALAALRRTDPGLAGRIPDLARIIAFRNILVHGYAGVDDRLVWGVIETELATLVSTLDTLMAAFPDQP